MDVVDRQSPGDTTGVAYEASETGRAIYISLGAFSLTATQFPVPSGELLTASRGLKCNLWGLQRAGPPQSISPTKTLNSAWEIFYSGAKQWGILKQTDCHKINPQLDYVHTHTHTGSTVEAFRLEASPALFCSPCSYLYTF